MTGATTTHPSLVFQSVTQGRGVAMYQLMRQLGAAAVATIAAATIAIAHDDSRRERDAYAVTPLVSNLAGHAAKQDPILQNAWGIAFTPAGSPFWVNDNATGCSTLYD